MDKLGSFSVNWPLLGSCPPVMVMDTLWLYGEGIAWAKSAEQLGSWVSPLFLWIQRETGHLFWPCKALVVCVHSEHI